MWILGSQATLAINLAKVMLLQFTQLYRYRLRHHKIAIYRSQNHLS